MSPPRDCLHRCCPDRGEIAHLHDVDPEDCFDCKALAEPVSELEAKALRIGARRHPGLLPEENE